MKKVAFFITSVLLLAVYLAADVADAQRWWPRGRQATPTRLFERLNIGAGGFTWGMQLADDGGAVSRTDQSQGYIRRPGETLWRPCITQASFASYLPLGGNFGPYDISVAPSNSDVVLLGYNTSDGNNNGRYYRSTDGCQTFTQIPGFPAVNPTTGWNGTSYKGMNNRSAIDPLNSNVQYACHPTQGVFRTFTGGTMVGLPLSGAADAIPASGGVPTCGGIQFDRFSGQSTCPGGVGLCLNRLWIPVWGKGVFKSEDAGATFTQISGAPQELIIPTITTTANDAVIMVVANTCAVTPASSVTLTDTTSALTFTSRVGGGGWASAGSGNCQWRVRSWWAYAPVSGTSVDITSLWSTYGSGDNNSIRAFVIYGANVSGANPFDVASATVSTSTNPATPPTVTTVSANAMAISYQLTFIGTTTATSSWTCISGSTNCYIEQFQNASGSLLTPTLGGTFTTYRGGFSDALKATGPGSISTSAVFDGVAPTPSPPQSVYKAWSSQCDGKYYALSWEGSSKTYRYDGGTTWTEIVTPTGSGGTLLPHPQDCGTLTVFQGGLVLVSGAISAAARATTYNINLNYGNPLMPDGITSAWVFPTIAAKAGFNTGVTIKLPTDIGYFTPQLAPDTPAPLQMWSLDLGEAQWNLASCTPGPCILEAATGFGYYTAPFPSDTSSYQWTEMARGMETIVGNNVWSIPNGGTFYSTADLGGYVNLSSSVWPGFTLPTLNNLAGLAGCWEYGWTSADPGFIVANCAESGGKDVSGYSTNGGLTQSDWTPFGGFDPANIGCFNPCVVKVPTGYMTAGAMNGGSIAPNACDRNNVMWAVSSGNGMYYGGRMMVTENALTTGAHFSAGSVSGTTLTVGGTLTGTVQVGQGVYYANQLPSEGVYITGQLTGTTGGLGTYSLSSSALGTVPATGTTRMGTGPYWQALDPSEFNAAFVPASFTGSISGTTLTVSSVTGSAVAIGQRLFIPGINTGAFISSGSGTTWTLNTSPGTFSGVSMRAYPDQGWNINYQSKIHSIASDKVDCDTFYALNKVTNTLYRSIGKGLPGTWSAVSANPPYGSITPTTRAKVFTIDGKSGWLFSLSGQVDQGFVAATQKLGVSTDHGVTWNYCPNVAQPWYVSVGPPKPGSGANFSMVMSGYVDNGSGYVFSYMWRSDDGCQTWTNLIQNAWEPQPSAADAWPQSPSGLEADKTTYGVYYFGYFPGSGFSKATIN